MAKQKQKGKRKSFAPFEQNGPTPTSGVIRSHQAGRGLRADSLDARAKREWPSERSPDRTNRGNAGPAPEANTSAGTRGEISEGNRKGTKKRQLPAVRTKCA